MQATRYHKANPKLQINTEVLGSAAAPEVVFKFIDDTEVSASARCTVDSHAAGESFVGNGVLPLRFFF